MLFHKRGQMHVNSVKVNLTPIIEIRLTYKVKRYSCNRKLTIADVADGLLSGV